MLRIKASTIQRIGMRGLVLNEFDLLIACLFPTRADDFRGDDSNWRMNDVKNILHSGDIACNGHDHLQFGTIAHPDDRIAAATDGLSGEFGDVCGRREIGAAVLSQFGNNVV